MCYAHADADLVFEEMARLRQSGENIWYDEGIHPGESWSQEIADAIDQARCFVYFVTPASVQSKYCLNEVQYALAHDRKIVAVHLEPTQLTGGLELTLGASQAILRHDIGQISYETKLAEFLQRPALQILPKPRFRVSRWPIAIGIAAIAILVLAVMGGLLSKPVDDASLAVLPFNNYAGPDRGYVADGIADGLISHLGRVAGLRVSSHASSFALKKELADGALDMAGIQDRLRVAYIVEGSIRESATTAELTIAVRVVDAMQDENIWSGEWDTASTSIMDIQTTVAANIGREIGSTGRPIDPASLTIATHNAQAYDHYLLGRAANRKPRSVATIEEAEKHFTAALARDDGFARAHAGLCDTHLASYRQNHDPIPFVLAQKSCNQALALDDGLWEVRLSLAGLYRQSGDYEKSLEEIDHAMALAPGTASIHGERGWTLNRLGQSIAAEAAFIRAIELEPGYFGGYLDLGNYYYAHVQYDKARRVYEQVLDLVTDDTSVRSNIATVQLNTGDFTGALSTYDLVRQKQVAPSRTTLSNIGTTYYYMGCYDEAATYQRQSVDLAPHNHEGWGRLAESCRFVDAAQDDTTALWRRAVELAQASPNRASWANKGLLAVYRAHLGDFETARDNLDAMWKLFPEQSIAHFYAAIVEQRSGNPAAARQAAARSLELGFPPALMSRDPDIHARMPCLLAERLPAATAACRVR